MNYRVNVVCIVEHEGRILLGRKAEGVGPYPGKWLIPGGGADLDRESIDEAMKREIREETGLTVQKFERLSFAEDTTERHGETVHLIFLYYRITGVRDWQACRPGDDLVELRWFAPTDLPTAAIPDVSRNTFRNLGIIS